MKSLRQKVIILFGSVALLLGSFCLAEAQYRSRVRVYHPRRYNNTRTLMSRRAAMRKVIKKHRQAAKKRRQALHQTH
jgi:alpha-N-acetylglucosamine transferase